MQTLGLSPSTPKPSNRLRELLWPVINDDVSALTAARNGMYVCFFVAVVTAVVALFTNPVGLLDAALFLMVGIGIRQLSRVAALTGLLLYAMSLAARDAGPIRRVGRDRDHFHCGAG
jgi:hypothetical protein